MKMWHKNEIEPEFSVIHSFGEGTKELQEAPPPTMARAGHWIL